MAKLAKPSPSRAPIQLVVGGCPDATPAGRSYEPALPVFAGPGAFSASLYPLGWIHWKRPHPCRPDQADFVLQVWVNGAITLLSCRRVNRADDPYGVYVAGNQVWCALNETRPGPIRAQIIGADIRESPREWWAAVLPKLLLSREMSQSS